VQLGHARTASPTAAPFRGALSLTPGSGAVGLMDRAALKDALPQMQVFGALTGEPGGALPICGGGLIREAGESSEAFTARATAGASMAGHLPDNGRGNCAAIHDSQAKLVWR